MLNTVKLDMSSEGVLMLLDKNICYEYGKHVSDNCRRQYLSNG